MVLRVLSYWLIQELDATASLFELLQQWICSHDTGHMWEASSPHLSLYKLSRTDFYTLFRTKK